jgi:hypothetical protein
MNPKRLKEHETRAKINYKALGLKKDYYGFGETPQERLRNLLSPTTNLAAIITEESKNGFKRLSKDQNLQTLIRGNAEIVSDQFQDIHDYLSDIPIFYKYFDPEGNPKKLKIWFRNLYSNLFR